MQREPTNKNSKKDEELLKLIAEIPDTHEAMDQTGADIPSTKESVQTTPTVSAPRTHVPNLDNMETGSDDIF